MGGLSELLDTLATRIVLIHGIGRCADGHAGSMTDRVGVMLDERSMSRWERTIMYLYEWFLAGLRYWEELRAGQISYTDSESEPDPDAESERRSSQPRCPVHPLPSSRKKR